MLSLRTNRLGQTQNLLYTTLCKRWMHDCINISLHNSIAGLSIIGILDVTLTRSARRFCRAGSCDTGRAWPRAKMLKCFFFFFSWTLILLLKNAQRFQKKFEILAGYFTVGQTRVRNFVLFSEFLDFNNVFCGGIKLKDLKIIRNNISQPQLTIFYTLAGANPLV